MGNKGFMKYTISIDCNHRKSFVNLINPSGFQGQFNRIFEFVIPVHKYCCFKDSDSHIKLCTGFHCIQVNIGFNSRGHLENCQTCR